MALNDRNPFATYSTHFAMIRFRSPLASLRCAEFVLMFLGRGSSKCSGSYFCSKLLVANTTDWRPDEFIVHCRCKLPNGAKRILKIEVLKV